METTSRGRVVELLPNNLFRVELETGTPKICYMAGKMKLHKIKVLLGDSVEVVVDPYGGKATNRIVRRNK